MSSPGQVGFAIIRTTRISSSSAISRSSGWRRSLTTPAAEPTPIIPSWRKAGRSEPHSITFNLQPNAKWQDGTPFTSKDVVTSLLVAGASFNPVWADITSVTAPNAHTVVIDVQPWAVTQNVLLKLFQFYTVPDSQYGHLLPSGIEQDILTYWKTYNTLHPTETTLTAATNSPAGKVLASVSRAIAKYNPPTLLGDGAYKLVSANVSGALYEKWTGFWDAKAISAPWVQIYPMTLSTQFGSLETGRIDFQQDTQFTDPQVTELNSSQIRSLRLHPVARAAGEPRPSPGGLPARHPPGAPGPRVRDQPAQTDST